VRAGIYKHIGADDYAAGVATVFSFLPPPPLLDRENTNR